MNRLLGAPQKAPLSLFCSATLLLELEKPAQVSRMNHARIYAMEKVVLNQVMQRRRRQSDQERNGSMSRGPHI